MLPTCAVHAGPFSTTHTTIEPDSGRNWKVKYMPAEVGQYTINLAWNDVEVDGMSSSDHLHLTLSRTYALYCMSW